MRGPLWLALCTLLISFFLTFILLSLAEGHEWFPLECCSNRDCVPIDERRVREQIEGYYVDESFFVPRREARVSQDGRYFACWPNPARLVCLFVPPKGM